MTAPLFVGLDAGGSKTCALATTGAGEPLRLDGPGAHALRDGPEAAAGVCLELIAQAQDAFHSATLAGVCVGMAGAGREEERARTEQRLRTHLGEHVALALVHDADIALEAAFGAGSGTIVIAGTGSIVYARTEDGRSLRAGGWGALLGDDGSGTALGRGALRAALAMRDGGPPTTLAERLAEVHRLDSAEAIVQAVQGGAVRLAMFAPLVLEAAANDDWAAHQIIARETNALAQQAGWVATRGGEALAQRVAFTGGLSGEAIYAEALAGALARYLPGWEVRRSAREPAEGALARAQRLPA
ncbi:MAG: BadF/BadG/BcrA/BcrD ATPase family protein [Rubricoccaceae bacterium]